MQRRAFSLPFIAVLLTCAGCDPSSSSRETKPIGAETPVRFQVRGVLQKLTADRRQAVIAHDDIAGYMKAMTMEFDVADPREVASIERGDVLAFRLSVTETKSWIDQIQKTAHTELPASPAEMAGPSAPIAASLPDTTLINERGQPFLRGRALAITFFFTRCPLPNFCPLTSRNFEMVARDLAATVPGNRWRLLSITIDPANDTPEVLAKYAASYQTNPEQWTFATGAMEDIQNLGSAFGLEFMNTDGQINHNLRTVVVNPEGMVLRMFVGNDWQPSELAAEIRRAISSAR